LNDVPQKETAMKKILVCIDGSPREEGVVTAAVGFAARTGAKIVLFRSVGLPRREELPEDAFRLAPNDVQRLVEERARGAVQAVETRIPTELRGGIRIALGSPWQAIVRAAREEDADLVVIGAHGYDALDHLVGTTAAKVVNHVDRAVLVVRGAARLAAP
jgi:nucleotide-binding universal stress UspA family protein